MWPHFSLDTEIAAEDLSEVSMQNHKSGKADQRPGSLKQTQHFELGFSESF